MSKLSITNQLLFAMTLAVIVGVVLYPYAQEGGWVKDSLVMGFFHVVGVLFLALLKMLVVPLVFCSLVTGVVGLHDITALGRIGLRTTALFIVTTSIAISMGIGLALLFGIGDSSMMSLPLDSSFNAPTSSPSFVAVVLGFVPDNMLHALVGGDMLQVIFIAIVIGLAILKAGEQGQAIGTVIASANEVMMSCVELVLKLAPYGVFALMAKTFALQGLDMLMPIISYVLVTVAALLLHALGTFSLLLNMFKIPVMAFFCHMREAQIFAFSTASSNATIPLTMRCLEEKIGVDNKVASFTVPFGATINMDGTAIMQGVATIFVANIYGVNLELMDYLTVVGMAVLASIGAAGVPGIGLITLAMVFDQVGLPLEGIALIMGIDRLLDMVRTAVNITGDATVTCVIARTEKAIDIEKMQSVQ